MCVCHEAKQSSKPVGVANLEAIDGVEEEGNKRSAGGAAQHSTALGFMGFSRVCFRFRSLLPSWLLVWVVFLPSRHEAPALIDVL